MNANVGVCGLIALCLMLAYFVVESALATTLLIVSAVCSTLLAAVSMFAPSQHTVGRRSSTQAPRRASEEYGPKSRRNGRSGRPAATGASGQTARCPYCSAGRNCPGQGKCQCKGCKAEKLNRKNGSGKPDLLTRPQLRSTQMVKAEKQHIKTVEKGK
jgi:hypothetical protein